MFQITDSFYLLRLTGETTIDKYLKFGHFQNSGGPLSTRLKHSVTLR